MKTNFTLIAAIIIFFNIDTARAQSPVFKEATLSHPAELWKPFKLSEDGNNVLNGLHFYHVKSECNSTKVSFIKLVNVNAYQVKFSYQLSSESPVVNVIVPPSVTIEGTCNSIDNNIKNLVITIPGDKPEEAKKNKEFLRSHISVTPF